MNTNDPTLYQITSVAIIIALAISLIIAAVFLVSIPFAIIGWFSIELIDLLVHPGDLEYGYWMAAGTGLIVSIIIAVLTDD